MKTPATISIALATRNGARFIAEQLDCLARQTLLPAELIVSDDASSDDTLAIVTAFAANAPFPVRIERNEPALGFRANFMKAASLCRSNLIAFCDQDDVWMPHKLEACHAMFANEDVLLTYHAATVVTATLEPMTSLSHLTPPCALNPPGSINPWLHGLGFTLMFRRELLAFADLWPQSSDFYSTAEKEAHDQWFFFLASCLGSIGYVSEPLALYRQHGTNAYGWTGEKISLRTKLRSLFVAEIPDLRPHAVSAAQRAAIFEQIEKTLPESQRHRVNATIGIYRKFESGYRRRQETVYSRIGIFSKLYHIAALTLQGHYRSAVHGSAGWRAWGRDIVRGVIFYSRNSARK